MPKVGSKSSSVPIPYELHTGDCLKVLPRLPAKFADAVVSDPPYGLGFMGKNWDHGVPGQPFWEMIKRAVKPGAYLLAFGGTRTFHRLAVAIEDAGWEIRDTIVWCYGSGFPKSLDVSKAIDGVYGAEREIRSQGVPVKRMIPGADQNRTGSWIKDNGREFIPTETAPTTDAAKQWAGWGSALKPAWEPIIVAQRPLSESGIAENVLRHGVGGLNIDGCRVGTTDKLGRPYGGDNEIYGEYKMERGTRTGDELTGRFPANLIHDGSDEVEAVFPNTGKSTGGKGIASGLIDGDIYGSYSGENKGRNAGGLGDSGSASRFFYCAKASKADRDEGLEGFEEKESAAMQGNLVNGQHLAGNGAPIETPSRANVHPTVKPVSLMRYLCRLVTPPGGMILDPFMGSGSTGKAAMYEGFRFTGIELEEEYLEIAKARIDYALKNR